MPEVADLGREGYCLLKNEHILRLQAAMGEAILVEKLQTVPNVYAKPPHELISVGPNQRAAMLSLVPLRLGCARFADRRAEVFLLRGEGIGRVMKSEFQKRLWADSWKMLAVALCLFALRKQKQQKLVEVAFGPLEIEQRVVFE